MIRKAVDNELSKIIDLANEAFREVRNPLYDFKLRLPRIYNNIIDYSSIHFVLEEDDGIRAVAGNLIKNINININSNNYLFSNVGTVATKPKYQNLGYMTSLLKEIDNECKIKNVDFSILTGKRTRYNRFGYELAGKRFIYNISNLKIDSKYEFRNMKEDDIDICYKIYLDNQAIILRSKDDFLLTVKNTNLVPYTIINLNSIVGYLIYDKKTSSIVELAINDVIIVKNVLNSFLNYFKIDSINLVINPLNFKITNELDKYYDKSYEEEILIKVYNYKKFLELLFNLNKNNLPKEAHEIYRVDNKTISINIKDGAYSIEYLENGDFKNYTYFEFIRFILGNESYINSNIFPLYFDIKDADLF